MSPLLIIEFNPESIQDIRKPQIKQFYSNEATESFGKEKKNESEHDVVFIPMEYSQFCLLESVTIRQNAGIWTFVVY